MWVVCRTNGGTMIPEQRQYHRNRRKEKQKRKDNLSLKKFSYNNSSSISLNSKKREIKKLGEQMKCVDQPYESPQNRCSFTVCADHQLFPASSPPNPFPSGCQMWCIFTFLYRRRFLSERTM